MKPNVQLNTNDTQTTAQDVQDVKDVHDVQNNNNPMNDVNMDSIFKFADLLTQSLGRDKDMEKYMKDVLNTFKPLFSNILNSSNSSLPTPNTTDAPDLVTEAKKESKCPSTTPSNTPTITNELEAQDEIALYKAIQCDNLNSVCKLTMNFLSRNKWFSLIYGKPIIEWACHFSAISVLAYIMPEIDRYTHDDVDILDKCFQQLSRYSDNVAPRECDLMVLRFFTLYRWIKSPLIKFRCDNDAKLYCSNDTNLKYIRPEFVKYLPESQRNVYLNAVWVYLNKSIE
jgi:hypothetical protein